MKTKPAEVRTAKLAFRNRYNGESDPGCARERAAEKAVLAAVQRNRLYRQGLGQRRRSEIRAQWRARLSALGEKYAQAQPYGQFEADLLQLMGEMNREFRGDLAETGYRVSHAQKSLAVYLKHLWCYDLIEEPPCCPVDRTILRVANAPWSDCAWTATDSLSDHERQLDYVQKAADASGDSLAVWELVHFPI